MRTTRRLAYSVGIVVSLIAAVVLPATAAAAGPQHSNFSGTKTNFHLCGFNTTLTFSVVDNLWPVFDSLGNLVAEKDIHQEKDIVTAANGRSIEIQAANMITTTFTTNPDGSFQIVTTYRGLSEQIKTPNGPVLSQDVGIIQFVNTFDSSGNFVSEAVPVVEGPHPEADSGFTLLCQVVTAALS